MFAGFQPSCADDRVALDRRRRRHEDHERVGPGRPQPGELRARRAARDLVRRPRRRPARCTLRGSERRLEAVQVVLAVAVVLVEDRDLRVRVVVLDVEAVDPRLRDVVGLPPDRPRILLVLAAELRRAGRDEYLRHGLRVQVRAYGLVDLRADGAHDREDLVLLDELARQLDGVDGVVAVVVVLPDDLAPVDAALAVRALAGVDVAEVHLHSRRDRAVARDRSGQRIRPADLDRAWR